MKIPSRFSLRPASRLVLLALAAYSVAPSAFADGVVDLGTVGAAGGAGKTSDVFVERGTAAAVAPTQSNLKVTQPQSIISRSFIEESVAPTGNFNTIVGIAPSAATQPSPNGPGLADTKTTLRGFQDTQYNVTWDGIPFGDTNDPSHHSTSYFPAAIIGGVVVERGPGNASNLGQSTYGGSINLLSKTPAVVQDTAVYGSFGTWNTQLYGVAYESGRLANGGDATLQLNYQHLQSDGYLTYNTIKSDNYVLKFQRPVGDSSLLTLFATFNDVKTNLPDSTSGTTLAQATKFGKNYGLNNDPTSQGFYGYNTVHKQTDFEYLRLQTAWGSGWETDNNLYTYYYDNKTIAGADATGFAGVGVPVAAGAQTNTAKFYGIALAKGVPGYDKLNHYRVIGDIFKATRQLESGLARMGLWIENADTERHNYGMDVTTGAYTGNRTSTALKSNQDSGWNQYQPFAEFEWAAGPGLTVTPGLKYMHFVRSVDAIYNQGSKIPAHFSEKFQDTLPFLTVNKMFSDQFSAYAQFAKGMQVPILDNLQVAAPANAPDPQKTTNYQAGIVHKSDRLTWDADIYYIDFKNYIASSVVAGQTVFNNNAGGVIYKGVEGQVTYVLGSGFALHGNASVNNANWKSGSTYSGAVAKAPKTTLALGGLYNLGPWNASLIYKQNGKQYAVANEPAAYLIGAYANTDLNVSYTLANPDASFKSVKVEFSVFNISDSQKVTSISTGATAALDQYQWQAPRSYMVSVKADF